MKGEQSAPNDDGEGEEFCWTVPKELLSWLPIEIRSDQKSLVAHLNEGLRLGFTSMAEYDSRIRHPITLGMPTGADAEVFINDAEIEMKMVPTGAFVMGSTFIDHHTEQPIHAVSFRANFWMGTTPVTQRQWESVMGDNPSKYKDRPNSENLPVDNVSWEECQLFLNKLNEYECARGACGSYRLPSESEWEYVCRAGSDTRWSFGDDEDDLPSHCWFSENSDDHPQQVGRKLPNPWGFHDMHGNVWEWCQDTWHDNYKAAPSDGKPWEQEGDDSKRILRGGSWYNFASGCRSAYRLGFTHGHEYGSIGLRLVWTPN